MSKRSYYHIFIKNIKKFKTLILFLAKLANVLLIQTHHHHSICCSDKWHTNRHLSPPMMFGYCEVDSGEPVQICRLTSLVCQEKIESRDCFG